MGYRRDLKHRITVRVSDAVKLWADEVGLDGVRALLERHLDPSQAQVENLAAKPVVVETAPVDLATKPKAEKRTKAAPKPIEKAAPVVVRSVIPVDLAAHVERIAAEKAARKEAREQLSPMGRMLGQYRK